MGNIDINQIRKKGFKARTEEERVETYCRYTASMRTDEILKKYKKLDESREGRYINSDLMKMAFPFYAGSIDNRRRFNTAITNTAAVLTNEAFMRAMQCGDYERCVFIVGPYGAGKSFFTQSLFENDDNGMLEKSAVYEGSITPPAFGDKIGYAIEHGVTPSIIALNPTFELSMKNIKERARVTGRDVEKAEVLDKFSNFYEYLKGVIERFKGISFVIYNKESNVPIDLSKGSRNLEDLYHGSMQTISSEYDRIKALLEKDREGK